jgi:uncharacterized protein (TIGR03437 family)
VGKILLVCGALACAVQAATTVTTNPASLAFTYQSGSVTLPKAQTVAVKISTGKPTFTTATAGDAWLTLNLNNGTLPASLSVSVNPTGLPVGNYTSSFSITVTGVVAVSVVPVTLTVTAPPSTLTINPATWSFSATQLDPPATQSVTLSTDNSPISFTATSGATWMTVSPSVGIVFPGEQATLTVTVSASGLAPTATPYTAKLTIVATGTSVTTKSQNVTVTVTMVSSPPTIGTIWPPSLPLNGPAQTLTITGANFYAATIAKIGTTALITTLKSPTVLFAVVPASMLTAAGPLNVSVENPPPGGDSATTAVSVVSAPVILGLYSAASYATAAFSPGELITIFGSNIGPATPAAMHITAGYVDTTLSTVTVTIDGHSAPILYVSSNQVTIQLPYEVAIGGPGSVVLTNNGVSPVAPSAIIIAATAPGIFTVDGSGAGQAAALNTTPATPPVVTLNSGTNPAKIGDTVTFYLTGEGDYDITALVAPGTSKTGYLIPAVPPSLPQMAPPTVQIGGVDATAGVSYAGPVPGSLIGVLQVNVAVPTGSSTGATVPVAISIGGNSTQSKVTINAHP